MHGARVTLRAAVLLALGAAALVPRARAQTVVVGPLASSMSALPGASVTVPVVADLTLSGGASLGSVAGRLTWRPATLRFTGATLGTLGAPVVNSDSAAFGILKFAVADPSGATGMPVLLNAAFSVSGPAADTTALRVSLSEINAAGSFTNLLPVTGTTAAQFCVSTGLWGDLDGDSTLTAADALIIVTSAVGLPIAPHSVVNGDVDGSGVVDTRDALIVLSAAVGLPVTQFRVGRLNPGSCALTSAASVQIQPRSASAVVGDSLPVTATVRDSSGAITQAVGLAWGSSSVATVRPGGAASLIAVAPGSATASVTVSPGIRDSIPVTVTATRHVWYVNAAVAALNSVELGSQVYPYSSIDTALAHAAPGDTIRVGTADYGPLAIAKPVVMLGDSSATGFPRIANAAGPALRVDGVPGTVVLRGFRLVNSQGGLFVSHVPTLALGAISVEASGDAGIRVHAVDSLDASNTSVAGAVGAGMALDSLRIIVLDHLRTDAIAKGSGGAVPLGIHVWGSSVVVADSLALASAGLQVDSVSGVTLRAIRVAGSVGPALRVRATTIAVAGGDFSGAAMPGGAPASLDPLSYAVSLRVGAALRFDSSKVHDNGLFGIYVGGATGSVASLRADSVARNYPAPAFEASSWFGGIGSLALAQSAFLAGGPGYVAIEGTGTEAVTVDSTSFDSTNAYVDLVGAFRMHGGALRRGIAPTLDVERTPTVELDSVEATGNGGTATYGGFVMPAVLVFSAESATVNGLYAHDNSGGALGVDSGTALRVNGGVFLHNAFELLPYAPLYDTYYYGPRRATIFVLRVMGARLHALSVQDSADAGLSISAGAGSRTVVDSSSLQGSGSLLEASGADSTAHLELYGNSFTAWGSEAANVATASVSADSNRFAGCVGMSAALFVSGAPSRVTRNTLTGCGGLIEVYGQTLASGPPVQVLGNTVTRDTTTSLPAVYLQNGLGYVEVAGNVVAGGGSAGGGGIAVDGAGYPIDSARVDSNSVRQTGGSGIQVTSVGGWTQLRYNLVTDNGGAGLLMYSPFTAVSNTVARNSGGGVNDQSSGPSSFRLGNVAGNLPTGMLTFSAAMTADSNWWNSAGGPKCPWVGIGCDTTSAAAGDVLADSITTALSALPAASASAPAIPLAAPLARPLAVRSLTAQPAPRPAARPAQPRAAPRLPRAVGRPLGRRLPVWRSGGEP